MELFQDPEFLNAQHKIKEIVRVGSIRESLKMVVKASPKKFFIIFFTLILPLSWFQFLLETKNLIALATIVMDQYYKSSPDYDQYTNSFLPYKEILGAYSMYYLLYLGLFLAFYLLSTAATTFTVASQYLSKPLTYISVLATIPGILKRFAINFLHGFPIILLHYIAYSGFLVLFCAIHTWTRTIPKISFVLVFILGNIFVFVYCVFIFIVHGHFIVWCNFASMVSVLEPNTNGTAAMNKSKQLLQEKSLKMGVLVFLYLVAVYEIVSTGNAIMISIGDMNIILRILISLLLVMALAVVNFLGLTGQNLFYYQNQVIEKGVSSEGALEMTGMVSNDNPAVEGDHSEV